MQVHDSTDFMSATEVTEFAPEVSEDFGLFARAVHRGFEDAWLSGLFLSYLRGIFAGIFNPDERDLITLLGGVGLQTGSS